MDAIAKDAIGATPTDRMKVTYDIALEGLEDKCQHLFEGVNADKNRTWSAATWSRKLRGH